MTQYLLDSSVIISNLNGHVPTARLIRDLIRGGHTLGTSCVNIAEVERGAKPPQRKATTFLLDRLKFLSTTTEAARRAGAYLSEGDRRGRTLNVADALIAGTARAHGAVLVTHNVRDFPMRDLKVLAAPAS